MASAPSLICAALLLLSWACMALGQGGSQGMESCVTKLMPCLQFVHGGKPTPICCNPLTEALKADAACLCKVFNDAALLKSFNVTKEEALEVPKACKYAADLTVCDRINGTSSAAPAGGPSASQGKPHSKSSAVSKKSLWGCGTVLAAAWVSLLILAF